MEGHCLSGRSAIFLLAFQSTKSVRLMDDNSYSRRNQLKPSWVTRIQESANGHGRTKVAATLLRCSCGRDQEQCAVTNSRDRDAATLAVIEKARASAACFLSRTPRPSPCSILFTALFLRSLLSSALLSLLAVPGERQTPPWGRQIGTSAPHF